MNFVIEKRLWEEILIQGKHRKMPIVIFHWLCEIWGSINHLEAD